MKFGDFVGLAKQRSRKDHPSAHNPHSKSLGKRPDGTEKGLGYLGPVKNGRDVSTELSMGVKFGDKEEHIPLMVPTLTEEELGLLMKSKNLGEVPGSVKRKSIEHAVQRKKSGKPVFFD